MEPAPAFVHGTHTHDSWTALLEKLCGRDSLRKFDDRVCRCDSQIGFVDKIRVKTFLVGGNDFWTGLGTGMVDKTVVTY